MKKYYFVLFLILSLNVFSTDSKELGLEDRDYVVRIVYGYATDSTLAEILGNNRNNDPQDGSMGGLQFERVYYNNPNDFPMDISFFGSIFFHKNQIKKPYDKSAYPDELSDKDSIQLNTGFKIYWYKFPWSKYVRTKVSVGEGVSWVNRIPNIEIQSQNTGSGENKFSKWLNYLDLGLAFNIGDMTKMDILDKTYAGVGISHRSGIFGTYNGVEGGSNYITFTLETDF